MTTPPDDDRMRRTRPIDALLLVDKPAGITSHDVVSVARRALGERRIGHAGTLDPFATGLLVLLIGRATRVLPYVDGEPKEYEATIRWGAETDTDDATGDGHARDAGVADARGHRARRSPTLTGRIEQVPPDYSAKQVGGRRAHAAARRGAPLALAPVPRARPQLGGARASRTTRDRRHDRCGGGTYIRALARDLGRAANSAAHLVRASSHAQRPVRCVATRHRSPTSATGARRCARRARRFHRMPEQRVSADDAARLARGMRVDASVEGERAALVERRAARCSRSRSAAARSGSRAWCSRMVEKFRTWSDSGLPPTARGTVLTVGTFDGVHRGHQRVLECIATRGERAGAEQRARHLRSASAGDRAQGSGAAAAHAAGGEARGHRRERDQLSRDRALHDEAAALRRGRVRRSDSAAALSRASIS